MFHSLTCKFCKRPITVEISDDYAKLHDPYKILPMACCNFCSDIRVERRMLEGTIQRVCSAISVVPVSDEKRRATMRGVLEKLTKKYAGMVARWYGMEGGLWEEGVLDVLMKNPNEWPDVLGKLWASFRQWQEQQDLNLVEK